MQNYKADMHIHSCYSFDSTMPIKDIIDKAEKHNLTHIALVDHVEFSNQPVKEVITRIKTRNQEIDDLKNYSNIKIIKGVEISEPHLFQDEVKYLEEIEDLDYILGSIHHILGMPIKKMKNQKNAYDLYLTSMLRMVEQTNIDTLAHLDYLKRHIHNGEFNKAILEEILKVVIEKQITLEINTSGYRRCGEYFPSNEIIEMYKQLGGKNIVMGSDAHTLSEIYDALPSTEDAIAPYNLTKGIVTKRRFRTF